MNTPLRIHVHTHTHTQEGPLRPHLGPLLPATLVVPQSHHCPGDMRTHPRGPPGAGPKGQWVGMHTWVLFKQLPHLGWPSSGPSKDCHLAGAGRESSSWSGVLRAIPGKRPLSLTRAPTPSSQLASACPCLCPPQMHFLDTPPQSVPVSGREAFVLMCPPPPPEPPSPPPRSVEGPPGGPCPGCQLAPTGAGCYSGVRLWPRKVRVRGWVDMQPSQVLGTRCG